MTFNNLGPMVHIYMRISEEECAILTHAVSHVVLSLSVANDNYTGIAARDIVNALKILAGAVRGVAAGTKNPRTQEYILTTGQTVSLTAMEITSLCV